MAFTLSTRKKAEGYPDVKNKYIVKTARQLKREALYGKRSKAEAAPIPEDSGNLGYHTTVQRVDHQSSATF
jgi:hypothetical protein